MFCLILSFVFWKDVGGDVDSIVFSTDVGGEDVDGGDVGSIIITDVVGSS